MAKSINSNTIISRQLSESCVKLYEFDKSTPLNTVGIKLKSNECFKCYGCQKTFRKTHPVYVFSCMECGTISQKFRHFSRPLFGKIAFVSGTRTKLGHQITLKLLRAGCIVIGSTRYPSNALELYKLYSDYDEFKSRLYVYPNGLDLDSKDLKIILLDLVKYIDEKFGKLDILINCAAQTIRTREKNRSTLILSESESNRYGDSKYVAEININSWQMTLNDLIQSEMEEVYRINAIAPCMIVQSLKPLMEKATESPYIINVHAREGLMNVKKSKFHMHLNMAKSGLAMLTKCLISSKLTTSNGHRFRIHGTDPGWISVDEYYESNCPWKVPPLDEIDGAARILYPLFANLDTCSKTRRHFYTLIT